MLAAIRIRGKVGIAKDVEDTLKILRLTKVNSMSILEEEPEIKGMLRKVQGFITWGELSDDLQNIYGKKTVVKLKPPQKGFKSIRMMWPKGDLGYRGAAINDLIKRMI